MNSTQHDVVKALVAAKKYDVITEYAHVCYPDKGDVIVNEYAGHGVRLYKDNKGATRILCPKNMDVVQEGHVAQAIANGTIFDDADEVDRNASVIERTSIPYDAMINSGKDTPKHLKPMIAIVIGRMDDNGSFNVSDSDRENGVNFVHDLCDKDRCPDTTNVVDNYLEKDKSAFYSPEMGKNITELDNEVDDIVDTKPEDVVTDDDTVDSYDDYNMEEIESDPKSEEEPEENEEGESDDDNDDDDENGYDSDINDDESEDNESDIEVVDVEDDDEPIQEDVSPEKATDIANGLTNKTPTPGDPPKAIQEEVDVERARNNKKARHEVENFLNYLDNLEKKHPEITEQRDKRIEDSVFGTKPVQEEDEMIDDGGSDDTSVDTGDAGDTADTEVTEESDVPSEGTDAHGNVNSTPIPMSANTKALLNSNSKYHQEGFLSKKPKKLKPIGRDVVAYITCEMNDIRSANDQAMLAGYTCSKIELVDFYLTCLDTQDARYIVPHNKQYLVQMKADLERLLAQILRIRPINRSEQIWRVNYPSSNV